MSIFKPIQENEASGKVKEIYEQSLNKKSRPFDGITEVLDLLNENEIYIGIITNKMHHHLWYVFRNVARKLC